MLVSPFHPLLQYSVPLSIVWQRSISCKTEMVAISGGRAEPCVGMSRKLNMYTSKMAQPPSFHAKQLQDNWHKAIIRSSLLAILILFQSTASFAQDESEPRSGELLFKTRCAACHAGYFIAKKRNRCTSIRGT